jgi:hypothetical protein
MRIATMLFVLAVVTTIDACSESREPTYSADPLAATVVDGATGVPLEGVNVVAGWEALGGLEGGNLKGWVMVMETVTDTSGRFDFPGWGPKRHKGGGLIRNGSPVLILFKSGYELGYLRQRRQSSVEYAPSHMHSDWDGQTIKLQRFEGSVDAYAEKLAFLDDQIDSLLGAEGCNWKSIPKFLWAAAQQSNVFVVQRTRRKLRSLKYMSDRYSKDCGSLHDYVEEHGK